MENPEISKDVKPPQKRNILEKVLTFDVIKEFIDIEVKS